MSTDTPQLVSEKIISSRKYRDLSPRTVQRVVESVAKRYKPKEIDEAARRLLHQIWGATWSTVDKKKLYERIDAVYHESNEGMIETELAEIMALHASSRERVPFLAEFYAQIFREIGKPSSIADYACGLNPFALPWMDISARTTYRPFDIDRGEIDLINHFFGKAGYPYLAEVGDLLNHDYHRTEVAFLFKVLPTLEQQEKGSAMRVLSELPSSTLVISFPTHSLGGYDKGMSEHYSEWFVQHLPESIAMKKRLDFPSEIVFIVTKHV